jgi:hypothetical protein
MDSEQESNSKRNVFAIGSSIILGAVCLISVGSPDGHKLEREFRSDLKPGTQMKDVIAYLKDRSWTYTWNKELKSIETTIPGAKWLPLVKPHYRQIFYFDDFNRLKSQNGNLNYSFN